MADFRLGRLKFNWRGDWVASTSYVIDDIVKFGANSYVCITNHTSVANETNWYATDFSKWSLHVEGITNRGNWQPNTLYKINDIIKFGNTQYRVTSGFSTTIFDPTAYLTEYISGFEYEDAWSGGTQYQPGDVVTYGAYNYISSSINTNKPPAYNLGADWSVFGTGYYHVGTYSTTVDYIPGDVVQFGGYAYVAISTSTNAIPIDTGSWDLIIKGINWVGSWNSTTEYNLGDALRRNSNSYISIASTNINNDPAEDTIGEYWNSLTQGAETNVLTTTGDLVYQSGAGPARLPIGGDGQVLTVNASGIVNWEDNNVTHPVYYVTEEGNDVNDGLNISRSFATIEHAVGIATGPATIYVKAGVYNEKLPIIIPEEVAVVGDNIRTTKIRPAAGNSHIQILTLASAPSQVAYGTTNSNGSNTKVATILNSNFNEHIIRISSTSGGLWTTSDTWENGASDIVITNVETRPNNQASMFLVSNKTMLKDLVMEGLTGFSPAGTVTSLTGTISGTILTSSDISRDLVGTTITGSGVSPGTLVVNVTNSTTAEVSVTQTVSSTVLTFTAPPSDINNATVGGVFVELNPSSPITKSPYVSQCSAFSSGGVGAIVDGRVHRQFLDNGPTPSNKSIVFDSYTNIHDNGVGFWVTNNGAAEFVSCFTYFAHISYAATRGGRIRSLAGNSSFGNFGLVSSGFNTEEEFLTGKIEGLILEYDVDTVQGPGFGAGEKIRGLSSGALGYLNSVQGEILIHTLQSAGPVGVGTGFAFGETIVGKTSGTTAQLIPNTSANRGIDGFTFPVLGISTAVRPGGSIEFVTGLGNGGLNNQQITGSEPFTFVIQSVSIQGPTGLGTISVNRGELTTVAAAHTGGTTRIINYPVPGSTTTLSAPLVPSDTTISVNSISGFVVNQFALINNELLKIQSFPSSNSMIVLRGQEGAASASNHANDSSVVSIGQSALIGSTEVWKDFTGISTSFRTSNTSGFVVNNYIKIDDEFMEITAKAIDQLGLTTLIFAEEKGTPSFDGQDIKVRYLYSQARFTGHDFLQVGTGGTSTTNWPSVPLVSPIPSQEVNEGFPGRVFSVTTDQDGNFRVGKYFRVNQATGAATLNASAFDLSGLTSLRLGSIGAQLGAQINEFSTDPTLAANSNEKVPTQSAVKSFVENTADNTLEDSKVYSYFVSQSS